MISYNNICVAFNGPSLFDNLSLHIQKGEKLLITGKSGVGKSTLLKVLPGFVPLNSGTVALDSIVLKQKTLHSIRQKIAYVSQGVELFGDNVESFIKSVFSFKANEHLQYNKEKIKTLFDQFELPQVILQRSIDELSGGEKQRVALVVAVMLERPVFLLDEPTAALDVHLKQKVASYFLENPDWTVIVISHDHQWTKNTGITIIELGEN